MVIVDGREIEDDDFDKEEKWKIFLRAIFMIKERKRKQFPEDYA